MSQPIALITGASSGMGAQYARLLASEGYQLILAARDLPRLEQLAQTLPSPCQCFSVDLTSAQQRQDFYRQIESQLPSIELFVANAGIGYRQSLQSLTANQVEQTIQLNVLALTEMTQLIGKAMCQHQRGKIILVSSIIAWMPSESYALYSASKAFVLQLGIALHRAWQRHGVTLTVSCPSTTKTEFFDRSNQTLTSTQARLALTADDVCRQTLIDLAKGKAISVPGKLNRVIASLVRLFPATWLARLLG